MNISGLLTSSHRERRKAFRSLRTKHNQIKRASLFVVLIVLVLGCKEKQYQLVEVENPEYRPNTAFYSYEDLNSPKFDHLIRKYRLDTVIGNETDEFRKILLLRNWIKSVIKIDDYGDPYPGDGFTEGILDNALQGVGFHCGHFMTVQNGIMNAFGFVTRTLGAGPGVEGGPDGHHGANEIWLNSYNKWFLSDAKYDHHFERDGIPLSALEVRESFLANKVSDIDLVDGPGRILINLDAETGTTKERYAQTYTWIEWHGYNDIFTTWPDYRELLIMYEDDYYRNHTWIWDGKPHWAYNTEFMVTEKDRNAIEWTPNTIRSDIKIDGNFAIVILISETPNLKEYQMREGNSENWQSSGDTIILTLKKKRQEYFFRTVNLAGVSGPEHRILIQSGSPTQVTLSYNFDRGSLGTIQELWPGYFKGNTRHWLKRDSIGDQYYWFYFMAEQVKDQTVAFEFNDLIGVYRGTPHLVYTGYTQPVYSYDRENWKRVRDVYYDSATHTFQFRQHFSNEPVWIAYAHPYPTSRLKSFLKEIKRSPYTQIKGVSNTKEGRKVMLVKITDSEVPDNEKKNILFLALQHAGEDAGAYMAEGMIRFLLSDDKAANEARRKYNYFIVPMMNPDGVYNGTSRYNMEMEDLNNVWMNEEKEQPEVTGIKNWVHVLNEEGKNIDLFIDIHNHSQFHRYNVFVLQDHSLDSLAGIMNKYWPIRNWHSEFGGSSCAYFHSEGIPSGTIELSQSHLDDGKYLEIEDYFSFGKGTVLALNEYF